MNSPSWTAPRKASDPPFGNVVTLTPPSRPMPFDSAAPATTPAFAARPPLPISSFLAGLVEPLVAVGSLLAVALAFGEPIERAIQVLAMLVLLLSYPGTNRIGQTHIVMGWGIVSAWAGVVSILALCGFATKSFHFFSHQVLVVWALLTPLLQWMAAQTGSALHRHWSQRETQRRPALVIGAGPLGLKVAGTLNERQGRGGVHFVGYADDRLDRTSPEARDDILGKLADVPALIQSHGIRDVYITLPLSSQPRIIRLMSSLQDSAASIFFVPDVFGVSVVQGHVRNLDGLPVVGLLESPFIGVNGLLKRASDIVLASVILVLISPIMLAVAIGVKRSSPGPVIFKQRRHGLDGREIVVYKFRSMTTQDNGSVVKQATRGDPRITPFGAFLRKTSLDELPQFINVLQGRMSIVGPRPHAVAHNEQYRHIIRAYMVRHKVKPGITGWAQVNGCRGETETVDKMAARVDYDIEYLRNWSLALDLKIVARTVGLTVFDRNAY